MLVNRLLTCKPYGTTIRKEEAFLAASCGEKPFRHSLDTPRIFPDSHSIKTNRKAIINGYSVKRVTRNEVTMFMRFLATSFGIAFAHNLTNGPLAKAIPLPITRKGWGIILFS
jgi:hypothetical protein